MMYGGAFYDLIGPTDPGGAYLDCWTGLPQHSVNLAGPGHGIRCCADD